MEYITVLIILERTSTFRYIAFSLLCYTFVSKLMSSKLDSNLLNYDNPHIIEIILGLSYIHFDLPKTFQLLNMKMATLYIDASLNFEFQLALFLMKMSMNLVIR